MRNNRNTMTEGRRALIAELLKKNGIDVDTERVIQKVDNEIPIRLTYQQEGMWFLEQLHPDQSIYNVPCCIRLRGVLDEDAFTTTIQDIVDRHDALRTRIVPKDGLPYLEIQSTGQFNLTKINLSSLSIDVAETESHVFVKELSAKPFDLARENIVRAALVKLAKNDHLFVFVTHHLVTDGWSMGVLMRELQTGYAMRSSGRAPDLPELPIRYADYAHWSRNWLDGSRLDKLVGFWRKNLDGVQDLVMPHSRKRTSISENNGMHLACEISKSTTEQIKSFSQKVGVTKFTTLMAIFRTAIFSFSEQSDQVIGSTLACRNRSELENVMGYFVNVLPFRSSLAGDPSFSELVQREKHVGEQVHEHQDLPFTKLVQELGCSRSDGANPVYQVQFALLEPEHSPDLLGFGLNLDPSERRAIADIELSPVPMDTSVSKFDLVVLLWDRSDGIVGSCEFDTDLFDQEVIAELWRRVEIIAGVAIIAPDTRLSQLTADFERVDSRINSNSDSIHDVSSKPILRRARRRRSSVKQNQAS